MLANTFREATIFAFKGGYHLAFKGGYHLAFKGGYHILPSSREAPDFAFCWEATCIALVISHPLYRSFLPLSFCLFVSQ